MSDDDRRPLAELDPLDDGFDDVDDRALETLLVDYRQAGEGGRYRDRFLHYTYYLALVALGVAVNLGADLASDPVAGPLAWLTFGVGGAVVFGVLLVWTESFRHARNACWARQAEIEAYLEDERPGLLEANRSVAERLTFEFDFRDRNWFERREVARGLKALLVVTVAGFLLVAFVAPLVVA